MFCLYNGEYGEHDLSHINGIEKIIDRQKESYNTYIGTVVGDFTILKMEYDWGRKSQRVEAECNYCHDKIFIYNVADWRRGKGRSTRCSCHKIRDNLDKLLESSQLPNSQNISNDDSEWIGKIINNCRIISYDNGGYCLTECVTCGKKRKMPCKKFRNGEIRPCNHIITNNYSDKEWIGKRNGHLTAITYEAGFFQCRCDCGNTIKVRGTDLFRNKTVMTCKDDECPYYARLSNYNEVARREGLKYEHKAVELFKNAGYSVEHTPDQGDFGVDFIVISPDAHRVAVQCKKRKSPTTLSAIQEVYAGGRYYDCDRFAVISPSGFTYNATLLAGKLGVYLAVHYFSFEESARDKAISLIDTMSHIDNKSTSNRRSTMWTVRGVSKTAKQWCKEYNISREAVEKRLSKGMTIEEALTFPKHGQETFNVDGVEGTLKELAVHFGVLPETVRWRMKYKKMSLSEALKAKGKCSKHLPTENDFNEEMEKI